MILTDICAAVVFSLQSDVTGGWCHSEMALILLLAKVEM